MAFQDFLTSFLTGVAGQAPGTFRSEEEEARRRAKADAIAGGFRSVEEMNLHQTGTRELEIAKKQRALAGQEADLKQQHLANVDAEAKQFANLVEPGQQTAFDIGGLDAVAGLKRKIAPDDERVLRAADTTFGAGESDRLRAQNIGLNLNKQRIEEVELEQEKEENDQANADRLYGLGLEKHKLAKTTEQRIQNFTDLKIDIMGEQLEDLKNGRLTRGQITPGQAMNVAQTILVNSGELEEVDTSQGAAGLVALRAQQIMDAFADPKKAVSLIQIDAVEESIRQVEEGARARSDAGTVGRFEEDEDAAAAETEFGAALDKEGTEQGEEAPDQEEEEQPKDPAVPGFDSGVPDARASDPGVSIQELMGLDEEQQSRKNQKEIDQDNIDFEDEARFNLLTGIPVDEWSPGLQAWYEAQGGDLSQFGLESEAEGLVPQ